MNYFWHVLVSNKERGSPVFIPVLSMSCVVINNESKCEDTYDIGRERHLRRTNSLELDTASQMAISYKHNQ